MCFIHDFTWLEISVVKIRVEHRKQNTQLLDINSYGGNSTQEIILDSRMQLKWQVDSLIVRKILGMFNQLSSIFSFIYSISLFQMWEVAASLDWHFKLDIFEFWTVGHKSPWTLGNCVRDFLLFSDI